jgi:hypothetical protein
MAIHYMMQDEANFSHFMDAVASLRRRGVFAGTLMNGDRVERLLASSEEYELELLKIVQTGGEVEVDMKDTYYFNKGPSKEPLIRPERLIDEALLRVMRLVGWTNFPQYLDPNASNGDLSLVTNPGKQVIVHNDLAVYGNSMLAGIMTRQRGPLMCSRQGSLSPIIRAI